MDSDCVYCGIIIADPTKPRAKTALTQQRVLRGVLRSAMPKDTQSSKGGRDE
jgi:hypothetical protein